MGRGQGEESHFTSLNAEQVSRSSISFDFKLEYSISRRSLNGNQSQGRGKHIWKGRWRLHANSFSTMSRDKGMWCCWGLVWFILFLKDGVVTSSQYHNKSCAPSRCGIITNISYPFRLRDDPPTCGHPKYELACEDNILLLQLYSGTYKVLGINYKNLTIQIVDPGIQDGDCSSLPSYFFYLHNFSDPSSSKDSDEYVSRNPYQDSLYDSLGTTLFQHVVYLNCSDPVRNDAAYLDTSPCVNW